jgi:hypothetical protein
MIGSEFSFYHFVIILKWVIALTGVLFSVGILLLSRRKKIK